MHIVVFVFIVTTLTTAGSKLFCIIAIKYFYLSNNLPIN